MPQDSLRSAVYRSFVRCDDPRGVVECKPIRKYKTEPSKMGERVVKQREQNNLSASSSKKGERKEMAWKGCAEELSSVSSVQLAEVSKGAEKLNRVIDSLSQGVSFDRQSKDIAKELLKGALDLQESLVVLGKLQEASQHVAKLKKRPTGEGEFDGIGIGRAKSERIGGHRYHEMEFEKPRFSVDGASGDCYEELREVIRESFGRQNLLPPSYPVKRVSFECRELELSPDLPSTSSSQSSFEKACFDRRKLAFTPDPPSTSSSQSSIFGTSLPKVKEGKPKGPNLIAKLMGLEEISSKPLQSTSQKQLEKDRLFNQRRPIFEIDLPKAKKPPSVVQKADPKRKTLEDIIETMQLKGLLKSKLMDGSKHETHQHTVSDLEERFDDGSTPIVIMRPFYAPELQGERFYASTSPCFECASITEGKVRRSRREEFLPKTTDWQKGGVNATFSRSLAAKNGQIENTIQEKGAKEHRETPKYPNENGTKVHAKLSSIKTKASDPGKPRQQKKEAIEKKLDKFQKVAPNLRKTEGMKNSKVRDAAKYCDIDKSASAKLRKADTVPHISGKQVTQQKSSTSDVASKRATAAASHNSRNKKNMKTDKPWVTKQVENKGGKLDLISKKETYKTETKVEASEKLYSPEASVVYENHITDDQISYEGLPCDSNVLTVACDINIESTGHEKSCTSPLWNEKTSSEATTSATRSLLLSSASFLSQAEELFGTDAWQPAAASFKHDCSQNGMAETKVLLDCACELLNNKKAQCTLSFDPLSSKPVRRSRVGISLDMLVSEICETIESLRSYKDPAGALAVDTLCSLTRKDQWCKGVVSGTWDLGWSKGFTSDEVEKIIADIEKHLLCGIIEDTVADFAV